MTSSLSDNVLVPFSVPWDNNWTSVLVIREARAGLNLSACRDSGKEELMTNYTKHPPNLPGTWILSRVDCCTVATLKSQTFSAFSALWSSLQSNALTERSERQVNVIWAEWSWHRLIQFSSAVLSLNSLHLLFGGEGLFKASHDWLY